MATLARRPVGRPPVPAGRDPDLAEFMRAAAAADHLRPRGLGHVLLLGVTAFFVVFLLWADWAELEEVTRGEGRVIPSRQVQIVQNLEGGIVAAILAREGDIVEDGQVVMRIDNVRAASDYREKKARYLALLAATARLQAELGEAAIGFPPEVLAEARDMAASEQALHASRQARLQNELGILRRQAEQREQELREVKTRLGQLERSYALVSEELRINEPLAKQRVVARSDFLKLQREVNDLKGELEQTRLAVPRVETAVREAQQRTESALSTFRADAQRELGVALAELAGLREIIVAGEDRVRRTEVRSPVRGTVKQLNLTTLGGVVKPGEPIMEIVPLDDTLLVEARVRPADIAFLRPGQKSMIKITAYDYSIFGGLEGVVEAISADTIEDEKGEHFYKVKLRTQSGSLSYRGENLPIIPGMMASVDILTGKKSVLSYLLKPILKMKQNALRER
jgi:adhesin transport system membrane fusion protein